MFERFKTPVEMSPVEAFKEVGEKTAVMEAVRNYLSRKEQIPMGRSINGGAEHFNHSDMANAESDILAALKNNAITLKPSKSESGLSDELNNFLSHYKLEDGEVVPIPVEESSDNIVDLFPSTPEDPNIITYEAFMALVESNKVFADNLEKLRHNNMSIEELRESIEISYDTSDNFHKLVTQYLDETSPYDMVAAQ